MEVESRYTKVDVMSEQLPQLVPGQQAPEFALRDARGQLNRLSDYADQNVIVYFYPKAATPGCTTEACDFRDNINSLKSAGYSVLGISPDAPEDIAKFSDDESLNFPLLSDPENKVAKLYGSFGEKTIGERTFDGTHRSTVVIDPAGKVIHVEYGVDAQGHVSRLRESLGV